MGAYFFRTEHSAADLRILAGKEKGRISKRFLMIANLLDGMSHELAARCAGLGRTSAYKWHNIYEEEGIEGLRKSEYKGKPPKVPVEIAQEIKGRILEGADVSQDGVTSFRGIDVKNILKNEYGIEVALSTVYGLLHRLDLSWLVPRPQHPRSDVQAQEHFRKHFICN